MTIKKSISWLVFSALLSSPGVANANGIDLQTGSTRVQVGTNGDINIQTRGVKPLSGFESFQSLPKFQYPKNWNVPSSSSLRNHCRNNSYSYNNTQRNSLGSSVIYTRNYASTTVCR
ncbi:MAG: hypothetical protein HC780_14280 [Leptolyngbyaceae cyanobacterium CSU_1_3]|nr:hypothetical protein [Leptolyngbyaceae cyanobacterium CSU_1_3]